MDSLFKLLLCLRLTIFSLLSSVKRKELGLSCVFVCEKGVVGGGGRGRFFMKLGTIMRVGGSVITQLSK